MHSPLLASDDGAIDLQHLRRMTLGQAGLEREVLGMFAVQASRLVASLAALPPDASELAHTLKGSAQAVGAARVADCAGAGECAIREGRDALPSLLMLGDAVVEACATIDALLQRV